MSKIATALKNLNRAKKAAEEAQTNLEIRAQASRYLLVALLDTHDVTEIWDARGSERTTLDQIRNTSARGTERLIRETLDYIERLTRQYQAEAAQDDAATCEV